MNLPPKRTLLRLCAMLFALLALPRAGLESYKLLFGQTRADATDLKNFHNQVVTWASGEDVYAKLAGADYPPASYPIMYPQYILENEINRFVWAAHAAVVLAILLWICVRESGADSTEERLCVALLPLAMFSTGVAWGNGQLVIHTR